MEITDAQLVEQTMLGDQGSFDELVRRYTKQIYNFSFRLTGTIESAEDITQETFIKVWKNLKKYDSNQNFRPWIFTIARNTATDWLRKKKNISFSQLSHDDMQFEDSVSDTNADIEKDISQIENADLAKKLLSELSPDYKSVLVLHYTESMTFDEIGTILNKPLNTVKSWHRRALLQLRKMALSKNPFN